MSPTARRRCQEKPSPFVVDVQVDPDYAARVDDQALRAVAFAVLAQERGDNCAELTLVVTADDVVHDLNRRYRAVDAVTDVLAFAADEPGAAFVAPDEMGDYLGDVIIAYPRAAEQAHAAGHAPGAELQLLVVHGVLHLLGYDHATAAGRRRMWRAQADALRAAGAPITEPAPPSLAGHPGKDPA